MGLGLEDGEIVYYPASEEGCAVGQSRFIDDDFRTFGFDSLHYALDGALAEVVAVGLHRQAENSYDAFVFAGAVPLAVSAVAVVAGAGEDLVCYEILPCAVGVHDGLNQIFGNIVVVGQELLRVFREAIAAVAEGRVVVVGAYAGVEADSVYD